MLQPCSLNVLIVLSALNLGLVFLQCRQDLCRSDVEPNYLDQI